MRPECCTDHLLELAVFTDALLSQHGIAHWLDYGALLGAVRSGELIPWDSDVDFGCFRSDLGRLALLREEIAAAGYELDMSNPLITRINFSQVNVQHVDIFPWVERAGIMRMEPHPGGDWPGMRGRDAFPRRFVDDLGVVTLYGRHLAAPLHVQEFLVEHRYGSGYMVPARPVSRPHGLPLIGPDDDNPSVRRLLDEFARNERRQLALLQASPWRKLPGWKRWARSGMPLAAREKARAEITRALVSEEDRSREVTAAIVESLAILRRSVEELERSSWIDAVVRLRRRAVRLGRKFRRKVRSVAPGLGAPRAAS
ncbi:MAG: LicD family protein [Acidimicrobiales bacterium]